MTLPEKTQAGIHDCKYEDRWADVLAAVGAWKLAVGISLALMVLVGGFLVKVLDNQGKVVENQGLILATIARLDANQRIVLHRLGISDGWGKEEPILKTPRPRKLE